MAASRSLAAHITLGNIVLLALPEHRRKRAAGGDERGALCPGNEVLRLRIFMVDRFGLLTDDMTNLLDFQKNLLTAREAIRDWQVESNNISLMDVVKNAHPTVMIGVSGQPGLFSEEIVKEMHRHCPRPVIMPLSNPTSRAEGDMPEQSGIQH